MSRKSWVSRSVARSDKGGTMKFVTKILGGNRGVEIEGGSSIVEVSVTKLFSF